MLRYRKEMTVQRFDKCHDGVGALDAVLAMGKGDGEIGLRYVHDDLLPPGVSIGEHRHEGTEEVYYVLEGQGRLILDGQEHPVGPGDISLCRSGHSHGLINPGPATLRLLVVCVGKAP